MPLTSSEKLVLNNTYSNIQGGNKMTQYPSIEINLEISLKEGFISTVAVRTKERLKCRFCM